MSELHVPSVKALHSVRRQHLETLPPRGNSEADNNAGKTARHLLEEHAIISNHNQNQNLLHIHYMKMVSLFKEIFLIVLFCIVYTALTNDFNPPKIGRPPEAYPFFSHPSEVLDLFKGDISLAINKASESDLVFIMVYAPWDAESQEVRAEFEKAAEILKGVVIFTAVNCWQPSGECRYKSNKVFNWPVLLAYTSQGKVVQYQGPKRALHMIRFLLNVMTPYYRVQSVQEVNDLLVQHDVVLLASVDCKPGSNHFGVIYNVALKLLEKDPMRETGVAIISNKYPAKSVISLHLWNETLIYPESMDFKINDIFHWISTHIHQQTLKLTPMGMKSQQLASYLQGPSLILFTPINPLANLVDYYIALKMVAMDYYNCNKDLQLSLQKLHVHKQRQKVRKQTETFLRQCKNIPNRNTEFVIPRVTFTPLAVSNWSSTTSVFEINEINSCPVTDNFPRKHCCAENANLWTTKKFVSGSLSSYKTSLNVAANDKFSSDNLKKQHLHLKCTIAILNNQFPTYYSVASEDTKPVEGLSCQNANNTLTLIAMDSLQFHHFAESFRLDVLNSPNKTALLLIDPRDESHYIFDQRYLTDLLIQEFIVNYTAGNLSRAFISSCKGYNHTHSYENLSNNPQEFSVPELNAENFMKTISDPRKVVVVLYHSKQCAFCSGFSHVFLETARLLNNLSGFVTFARIDAELNTLPWEYTMESLPTIILFPSGDNKAESRVFPNDLPFTIENLLSFLLVNSDASTKLHLMWTLCLQTKHPEEFADCIKSMRIENLLLIEDTLKEWRKTDPMGKQMILYKLQKLKNIHTRLAVKFGKRNGANEVTLEMEKLRRFDLRARSMAHVLHNQFLQWKDNL